jgi:hypothetical protein
VDLSVQCRDSEEESAPAARYGQGFFPKNDRPDLLHGQTVQGEAKILYLYERGKKNAIQEEQSDSRSRRCSGNVFEHADEHCCIGSRHKQVRR